MNCSNCGSPIPAGAAFCPRCGAPATSPYAPSGGSYSDPTVASAPDIPPPPPSTAYGEPPYGGPPYNVGTSNPYNTPPSGVDVSNPYNTPASPYGPYNYAPPPSPQLAPPPTAPARPPERRGNRLLLIVVPVLVAILVLGGVLALVLHGKTPGTTAQATPTPALSASQLTATAQANMTATANANMTATASANLTATASVVAANQDPYASGGTLVMLDPLTDNTRGFGWAQGTASDNSGACTFMASGYQVNSNKTQYYYFCPSSSNTYTNFTFEVHVQVLKGDCGGMIFRADTNAFKFYLYEVCSNGSYNLYQYLNTNGDSNLLANAHSPAIKSGVNQTNVLAVTAQGTSLTLYMNGQKLTSVTNNAYSQGEVALVADSFNNTTGVLFSDARLWTL